MDDSKSRYDAEVRIIENNNSRWCDSDVSNIPFICAYVNRNCIGIFVISVFSWEIFASLIEFYLIHIETYEPMQNGGNLECPDLDFIYNDTDTQINEIAELYSYTEQNEFHLNAKVCSPLSNKKPPKKIQQIFAKIPSLGVFNNL